MHLEEAIEQKIKEAASNFWTAYYSEDEERKQSYEESWYYWKEVEENLNGEK